ncbi:MAG: tetratricopeptide repeat protein [Pseudomonadota bacterium]
MAEHTAAVTGYSFGDFEVIVDRRELLCRGEAVELEPRVFDLLVYLLAHRQSAVSKDELLGAIWPNSYVSETSLTRCIMKARRAIGDDAEKQSSIRTIHGHGYRFVGDVDEIAQRPEIPEKADNQSTTAPVKTPQWRHLSIITGIVIGVAAVLAAVGYFVNPEPAPSPMPQRASLAVLPVQNNTGEPALNWVSFGLMDSMTDYISRSRALEVIDADELVSGFRRARLPIDNDSLPPPQSASVTAFQQFGVDYVLSPVLLKESNVYRVRASILARDREVASFDFIGDQPTSLAHKLAQFVLTELVGDTSASRSTSPAPAEDALYEAYLRGREQLLRGNVSQAIEMLGDVVAQQPLNFKAQLALVSAWMRNGETQRSENALNELLVQTRANNAPLYEGKVLSSMGRLRLRQERHDEAEAAYQAALDLYEEKGFSFHSAKMLFNLAQVAGERGELTLERARLELAARAFETAGMSLNSGQALGALGNHAMDQGDVDAAEVYFTDALSAFRAAGWGDAESVALFSLSRVADARGDFPLAASFAQQSLDVAREHGDRWAQARSWRRLGMVHQAMGRLELAEGEYLEALHIAETIGADGTRAATIAQLAELNRLRGHFDAAADMLGQAQDMVEATNNVMGRHYVQIYWGRLALARGDVERALAIAQETLEEPGEIRRVYETDALYLMAMSYAALSKVEDASRTLRTGLEAGKRQGDRVAQAQAASTLGIYALAYGDKSLAPGYLGLAQEAAPMTYHPMILEAALAAANGEPRRAEYLFLQARERAGGQWSAHHSAWQTLFDAR